MSMAKRRSHKRTKRYARRSRSSRKPIGFVKKSGKFRLVFGKRGKPSTYRVSKKGFKTKTGLAKHFVKKYGRR